MPVPAVQRADDRAGGDLERGEQGGGAVPDVVVGAPLRHARAASAASAAVRSSAWIWDFVRHEALHYRMEVRGLHPWSVAAGW